MKPEGEKEETTTGEPESVSLEQKLTSIESGSKDEPTAATPVIGSAATTVTAKPWLSEPPKKNNKKKWLVGGLIAFLVVVFGGGSALYAFWFQKPEKVVLDAVSSAFLAKTVASSGTYSVVSETATANGTFALKSGYTEGFSADTKASIEGPDKVKLSIDLSTVGAPNGDTYFKLKELRELYDAIADQVVSSVVSGESLTKDQTAAIKDYLDESFLPLIEKIDNKWVKVAVDDFKKIDSKLGENYECSQKVYETLSKDKAKTAEIRDVYLAHQFIKVTQELGEKDGNVGYRIEHDDAKWKQFSEKMKQTWAFKEIENCSEDKKVADDLVKDVDKLVGNDDTATTFRIWVGKWDHKLKSAELSMVSGEKDDETKITVTADFKLDESVTVDIPKDVTPITDIIPSVSNLLTTQKA